MNHPKPLGLIVLIALIGAGCDESESTAPSAQPAATGPTTSKIMTPKAQVKVLSDGSLLLDGQAATLQLIDQRFQELGRQNGVVWYYREPAQSEPPEAAIKVMELIVKHGLPISMSSRSDFSDTIDDQGVSRPRRSGE